MFWALEPCWAQAPANANVRTAAKSHCVMRPSSCGRAKAAIVPEGRHAPCGTGATGDARGLNFTHRRCEMIKTLIAVAVAGAFALPVAALASAGSDNVVVAQAGGDASTGTASPGSPR